MPSSSAGDAFPVRTRENSRLSASHACCILSSDSSKTSSTMTASLLVFRGDGLHRSHQRSLVLADDDPPHCAPPRLVEHHDGQLVVSTQRRGGAIHKRQIAS